MRLVNPSVRRVLASPLLGRLVRSVVLLDFAGRRTGRRLRIPVAFHTIDGVPMVITDRPWRRNFTGGAPVTATHAGRTRRGRGTLLDVTPEQLGTTLRKAIDNGTSQLLLGIAFDRGNQPSVAELAALDLRIIRLDFDPAVGTAARSPAQG